MQERANLFKKYEESKLEKDDFGVRFFAESKEHDLMVSDRGLGPDEYFYEFDDASPLTQNLDFVLGFDIRKIPGEIITVFSYVLSVKETLLPIRNALENLLDPNNAGTSVYIELDGLNCDMLLSFDMLTCSKGFFGYSEGNSLMIMSIYKYDELIFDALVRKKDIICMFYIRLLIFAKRTVGEDNEFYKRCVKPAFEDDEEFKNFFPKGEFFLSKIKSPAIEKYITTLMFELSPRSKRCVLEHLNKSH